jgi:hypothetical protein
LSTAKKTGMTVIDQAPELGAGLYSANELSRYLSSRQLPASPPTVARWIHFGLSPSEHRGRTPTYTFHDLISLLVVGWLRGKGVKLAAIRRAEAYLRQHMNIERPFAREEIYTTASTSSTKRTL